MTYLILERAEPDGRVIPLTSVDAYSAGAALGWYAEHHLRGMRLEQAGQSRGEATGIFSDTERTLRISAVPAPPEPPEDRATLTQDAAAVAI